jgi:hypothetical protein
MSTNGRSISPSLTVPRPSVSAADGRTPSALPDAARRRSAQRVAKQEFASPVARERLTLPSFAKMDSIIEAKELQIERKRFHVEYRENDRGRFLRITEEAHGRRNTIIVPSTGVSDFTAAIGEVLGAGQHSA